MRGIVDVAKRAGAAVIQRYQRRYLRDHVHCTGKSECARRRRQIEAGTLMTTERIQRGLALRRGPAWVGTDYSSEPDRTEYFPIVISSEGNRP